jgi:damage-control phosphatase, subfamily I
MRYQPQCIECSRRQGVRIYELGVRNEGREPSLEVQKSLQRELDERLECADPSLYPAALSLIAIRLGEKYAQCGDPFKELKRKNNELALSFYPGLKTRLRDSADPLHFACQLAACGNIIDLGIHDDFDLSATIEKVVREGFRRDDFPEFAEQCRRFHEEKEAPQILYVCDNAGEIVFDRLFIEEILRIYPRFQIIAAVRGIPVLNDATLGDARDVGLTDIVRVIDNGESELGTILEKTGREMQEAFKSADIIISKGQANYETLCVRPENIFFILKAKCEVIADSLGVYLWDAVLVKNSRLKDF